MKKISTLRIKAKFFSISLINVHAPTEDKDEEVKDEFYGQLEAVYDSIPSNDIKIVLGDFNAKLGQEESYRPFLGRHSLHEISNENGMRMIDFAISKNMSIRSTQFPHKNIHKETWRTPDGLRENQIDHVMIDFRHASDICDVKSCRGADGDSDHNLVRIMYRQRISLNKRKLGTVEKKWNIEKLKLDEKCRENISRK
uniref:Putative endonuclease-reverse transcriptase panstrongylus lignarius n=1 Tax=Rhodnius prolixus TaxID=13249 RepID=A0A4P6DBQ5_RHOPR